VHFFVFLSFFTDFLFFIDFFLFVFFPPTVTGWGWLEVGLVNHPFNQERELVAWSVIDFF
jgi:hypothetical protein